jgi:Helicase conserved C-terminal domain
MSAQEVVADRVAAIKALTPAELARTLALQPHVAAWCARSGPLRTIIGQTDRAPDHRQLAAVLSSPNVIRLTLELLSQSAYQLVVVAASQRGALTRSVVDRELEPLAPDQRQRLVDELAERLIIDPSKGYVVLRPGIADHVGRPGRPLDRLLLDQSVTSDRIASWLHRLDVHPVPSKKSERIESLRAIIGDAASLHGVLATMTQPQQHMFERLLATGGFGATADRLDVHWWQLKLHHGYEARSAPYRTSPGPTGDLQALIDLGLVWVEDHFQHAGLWLETITAINGRTYAVWPAAEEITPAEIDSIAVRVPEVLSVLHTVLRHVATEPIVGLKNGGIGVKAIRDLAKRLGQSEHRVGVLLRLVVSLGMIVEVTELIGKGRSASWVQRFEIEPLRLAEWNATDAPTQWTELVAAWMDGTEIASDERLLTAIVRRQTAADLQALAAGFGIARTRFTQWCTQAHLLAGRVDIDGIVEQLIALDLVPTSGPIGLTTLARTLLTDPHSLGTALPQRDLSFVVQADFTVVAPPALDPDIKSRLDRLCTVESSGSVTLMRLDRARIAAEMAGGESAAELLAFLEANSSVAIAPVVAQMLTDVERERGGLSVTSAATVVTADDVLGLAAAVKVKAARLTLIAPTVAVSDQPPAKVIAALRAKGLAPRGMSVGGSTSGSDASPDQRDRVVHRPPRLRLVTDSSIDVVHPDLDSLERLVGAW